MKIDGIACTSVVFVSSVQLTCTTPADSAGAKNVVVTNPDTQTSGTSGNGLYTYAAGAAPTVSLVATNGGAVGDIAGTYAATVTGTNFVIGATTFTFGGTSATGVTVSSSTTATMTVPAHATGAVSVVATTAGGSNGANTLFRYFSPAELTLSMWHRDFAGAPWVPTASAGASGTNANLVTSGTAPTVGTAVNGHSPADFNGTTKAFTSATVFPTYFTGDVSGSVLAVYKPRSVPAADGVGAYNDPAILGDNGGWFAFVATALGASAINSGAQQATACATGALTNGALALVATRWDSANIGVIKNSAAEVLSSPATTANAPALSMVVGRSYTNVKFIDGELYELLGMPAKATNQQIADIKSYVNTRYNLTL